MENVEQIQKPDNSPSENGTNDIQTTEMKGWLMKRTKLTHKWNKTWFHIANTELSYGKSSQVNK